MRTNPARLIKPLVVTLGVAVAAVALAQTLPNLPKDFAIPQHKRSPGVVTFKHGTHVDLAKPDCTSCHPTLFKITKPETADGEAITHKIMKKGGQCGACHDGEKSFGLDECERCHAEE